MLTTKINNKKLVVSWVKGEKDDQNPLPKSQQAPYHVFKYSIKVYLCSRDLNFEEKFLSNLMLLYTDPKRVKN